MGIKEPTSLAVHPNARNRKEKNKEDKRKREKQKNLFE